MPGLAVVRRSARRAVDGAGRECHTHRVVIARALSRLSQPIVAIMTILALAVVQVPAMADAVVRCCCGEHSAGHDCGCIDCPAGHRGDPADDETPSVRACGASSPVVVLANLELAIAAPLAPVRDLETIAPRHGAPAPHAELPAAPPSPPPRR